MPENYKFETFPFYKSNREWGKENYIMESSRWPLARHMGILICMGIANFALAFLGINAWFFFPSNFGIFYVCPCFKVVWVWKSSNSRFASLLTNSLHIHHIN